MKPNKREIPYDLFASFSHPNFSSLAEDEKHKITKTKSKSVNTSDPYTLKRYKRAKIISPVAYSKNTNGVKLEESEYSVFS